MPKSIYIASVHVHQISNLEELLDHLDCNLMFGTMKLGFGNEDSKKGEGDFGWVRNPEK